MSVNKPNKMPRGASIDEDLSTRATFLDSKRGRFDQMYIYEEKIKKKKNPSNEHKQVQKLNEKNILNVNELVEASKRTAVSLKDVFRFNPRGHTAKISLYGYMPGSCFAPSCHVRVKFFFENEVYKQPVHIVNDIE